MSNEPKPTAGRSSLAVPWDGCLRIAEDEPGRRLVLVWRGLPPHFLLRNGLTLFLILFLAAFFGAIWISTAPKLPPGWFGRFDVLWRVAALFGLFGGAALFVCRHGSKIIGRQLGYWRRCEWNGETGEFRAAFRGLLFGGGRRLVIPLETIRQISLILERPANGRLPLELQAFFRNSRGRADDERLQFEIENLDQRGEALDLLFRIGRIAGLKTYGIAENTVRRLEVKLVPSASDVAGRKGPAGSDAEATPGKLMPVPEINAAAQYDLDVLPAGVPQPPITVPPFKLTALKRQIKLTQITTWEPGNHIRFLRPRLPGAVFGVMAVIGAIVGGVVGGFLLAGLFKLSVWVTALVGVLLGAPLAAGIGAYLYREREVSFDWPTRQLWWRESNRPRQREFDQITAVVLRGTSVERHRDNDSLSTEYRTDIFIETTHGDVLVIGTDTSDANPDEPFRILSPLAAELGAALNVAWRWEEYTTATKGLISRWLKIAKYIPVGCRSGRSVQKHNF